MVALSSAIVLFSGLWADASHSADSGTALAHRLVVGVTALSVVVLLANRSSALVDVLVWRKVIVVGLSSIIGICLVELIQD